MNKGETVLIISGKKILKLMGLASYQIPMQIVNFIVYLDSSYGYEKYYVCPRCQIPLERDFMSFCSCCGQKLDWKNYKKAKRAYLDSE